MKKFLALLLVLAMILSLCACGTNTTTTPTATAAAEATTAAAETQSTSQPAAAQTDTVTFTDSAGRNVEVPAKISKIAVTGPLAQIVLFSLAPDKLVGIATPWDVTAAQYFDSKYYNLPVLGQLYGGKGELNLEELLAADPDVVIDVGDAKDTIVEDMNSLQQQTGIPFVHIDASISTMGDAYRALGKLLGMQDQAEALAKYCESVYSMAQDVVAKVGADNKTSLLYCLGDDGLSVIAKGSYHSEVIDMLSDNLAAVDDPSSKGTGNQVDMEQLLKWNPQVILFAPGSVYNTVGKDATWQQLSAIKNGKYYEVPSAPYNWLGFPPSVQRCLGILWLADLLYPDQTGYDLYTEVAQFYSLFYHCTLTQAQFDALMANSK